MYVGIPSPDIYIVFALTVLNFTRYSHVMWYYVMGTCRFSQFCVYIKIRLMYQPKTLFLRLIFLKYYLLYAGIYLYLECCNFLNIYFRGYSEEIAPYLMKRRLALYVNLKLEF